MNGPRFIINGTVSDQISIQDRGLHYGDGVFETIAIQDGQPLAWQPHLERLQAGCSRLKFPNIDTELLQQEVKSLCSESSKAVLKIIITRGTGGRGYAPPAAIHPTRILGAYPWPDYPADYYRNGIRLRVCDHRMSINPTLAGIKHLNRLEQVLARSEWQDDSIAEGLVLDTQDHVIEGTMSNVFLIKDEQLITPDLSGCGVPGVIRAAILELASKLDIKTKVQVMDLELVREADAMFTCNSILGLWEVVAVDEQGFNKHPLSQDIRNKLLEKRLIATL